jgi:hypothetical protein
MVMLRQERQQFPWRIFYRVVVVHAALVIIALLASGLASRYFFKRHFVQQVKSQLQDTLSLLSRNVSSKLSPEWCLLSAKDIGLRITAFTLNGKLLCDSHPEKLSDPSARSYSDLPEVKAALREKFGQNIRFSTSANEEMFYGALAVPGSTDTVMLRGAVPLGRLSNAIRGK